LHSRKNRIFTIQNASLMNLAKRKHMFIQSLDEMDEELFRKLEQFLKLNSSDFDWTSSLSKDELQEIEAGLEQADNNELIEHDQVMKKFE